MLVFELVQNDFLFLYFLFHVAGQINLVYPLYEFFLLADVRC